MNHPAVSIVILNWNGLEDTVECLESLQKTTYPNYQVVVVDNASEGNDVQVLCERFAGYIHVIGNDKNYGFAAGNNIGIRHALQRGAEYVFLLNNDTVVDPKFLDEMVAVAEADRKIGVVCPLIYWHHQPDQLWFGGERKVDLWRGTITPDRIMDATQAVVKTEFATGAAMLIRRKTIEEVGLLPDYYVFGVEDIDYSIDVLRKGFTIVVAGRAKVWHKVARSSEHIGELKIGYQYRGWQIMRRKYLPFPVYLLTSVCGLIWAVLQFSSLMLGCISRGDRHGLSALLSKSAHALRGSMLGSFTKIRGLR